MSLINIMHRSDSTLNYIKMRRKAKSYAKRNNKNIFQKTQESANIRFQSLLNYISGKITILKIIKRIKLLVKTHV